MIALHKPIQITLLLLAIFLATDVQAQGRNASRRFQGEWNWGIYPTKRSELPPAYRNERLKDVPVAAIYLKIKQRGQKLTGEYSASRRYLAKLEDGEFDAVINKGEARFELQSGFGGTVQVVLTLQGSRLHWKVIAAAGVSVADDRRLMALKDPT
jgi:hypothetical protein